MKHIIEETIHYLNYVTQSDFHSDFQPTVHELQNLIDLGYTLDDFKKVIDKKWADWKGTDFQNYMRPSTLFGKKFETQDTRVVVETMEDGKKQFFDFQIKPNTTSELANLKFEPTASGAAKARLGKTPLDKLALLFKKYDVKFVNTYKNYPLTLKEFTDKNSVDYAKSAFNQIKNAGVDVGSCKNADELVNNLQKVFTLEPHIATSKLMQLNFLYHVTQLPKEKMDDLFTDMSFLAQKKGREFGPFGKLY